MSNNLEVIELRIDNVESLVNKHDSLIQQLVQSQIETKTGLAKVATELEITNGLIATYMSTMQKALLALIGIVGAALGVTQM
jgi:predicted transcriptional regulator